MTLTIRISETGSVEIPQSVRDANGWTEGTELELVAQGREVVLRPTPTSTDASRREALFPPITIEEFLARRPTYTGPPVSIEEMDEAVLREAKRRWLEKMGG